MLFRLLPAADVQARARVYAPSLLESSERTREPPARCHEPLCHPDRTFNLLCLTQPPARTFWLCDAPLRQKNKMK